MSLAERNIPGSVIELVPESVARENEVVPISYADGLLVLACPHDQFEQAQKEKVIFILNCLIEWEPHSRQDIRSAIDRHYDDSGRVDNCGWQFRYQCPHQWSKFTATDDNLVRFCPVCSRNVYWCADDAAVIEHAKLGHCIAKMNEGIELLGDVAIDP